MEDINAVERFLANQQKGFSWDKFFPDILWICFWLLLVLLLRKAIAEIIRSLLIRLKHGASVKIGSFELQGLKISVNNGSTNSHFQLSEDYGGQREKERIYLYEKQRGVMLVHKIFKSQKEGQLYDILMYMIPHKNSNLIQVTSVDYSFGRMWNNKIFTTADRSNGFAIATSAYGPFLCSAKINFNDGKSETVFRYIDFEMGDVASMTKD